MLDGLEQVEQDRRRDVVRQVADHAQRRAGRAASAREVDLQHVGLDDVELGSRRAAARRGRGRARSRSAARSGAASGPVSAPRPGPISTSAWPGRGSIASTIASTTAPSVRKCWPKRLRATCFTTARRSGRRLAHLDVGAPAQVAHPFVVGVLELLLAQDVARLLAQLLRVERDLRGARAPGSGARRNARPPAPTCRPAAAGSSLPRIRARSCRARPSPGRRPAPRCRPRSSRAPAARTLGAGRRSGA